MRNKTLELSYLIPLILVVAFVIMQIIKTVNGEPDHGSGADPEPGLLPQQKIDLKTIQTTTITPGQSFIALDGVNGKRIQILKYEVPQSLIEFIITNKLKIISIQIYEFYPCSDDEKQGMHPQEYYNRNVFFWRESEPFEKRSLPEKFKTFQTKQFISSPLLPDSINVGNGTVAPWFGQPGGGIKYFFGTPEHELEIQEVANKKWIDYVEWQNPSTFNLEGIGNPKDCLLILEKGRVTVADGNFFLEGRPIPLDVGLSLGCIGLYKIGARDAIQIIKF